MVRVFDHGYYESRTYISKIKLLDEELKDLVLGCDEDNDDTTYTYFIKDEEDEYGNKLNPKIKMNREEIKIKCLELAVDYMNHLTNFQNGHYIQDDKVVAIAKTFENYITKED